MNSTIPSELPLLNKKCSDGMVGTANSCGLGYIEEDRGKLVETFCKGRGGVIKSTLPWKVYMKSPVNVRNGIGKTCQINAMEPFSIPAAYSNYRNPIYTRHTQCEWDSANYTNLYLLDSLVEKHKSLSRDNRELCRQIDDKSRTNQSESTVSLGTRITDEIFWRNKVFTEADKMLSEVIALNDSRALLEEVVEQFDQTLTIDQDIWYIRDTKYKEDLYQGETVINLLSEVGLVIDWKRKIQEELEKVSHQLAFNRQAQCYLEQDLADKFKAVDLDETAYQKRNTSSGISCHKDVVVENTSRSNQRTWLEATMDTIKNSEQRREESKLIRRNVDFILDNLCQEITYHWNLTNEVLRETAKQTLMITNTLRNRLCQLNGEIYEVGKSIDQLRKCMEDRRSQLHVVCTRLETRRSRPNKENSCDVAQHSLLAEHKELMKMIAELQDRLCHTEGALEEKLAKRTLLEEELATKNHALYVDRERFHVTGSMLTEHYYSWRRLAYTVLELDCRPPIENRE
ncbi:tektin-3-like [Argonauta hians]